MLAVGVAYDILRWEERAIIGALRERGANPELIHLRNTFIELGRGGWPDYILQRSISHSVAAESASALESAGATVINGSLPILISNDKLLTLSILSSAGVPTPRTLIAFTPEDAVRATDTLGYPVVLKPVNGSWGRMVARARDEEELKALLDHRMYVPGINSQVFLVQEYVEKPGRDIRVFVLGEDVPTAIYRVSDHWITNTARGGRAEPARVDEELREIAIRTAEAIGADILGVDVFEDPRRGYVVNEVNAVPEFKNTVRATGYPLHESIAEYVLELARR